MSESNGEAEPTLNEVPLADQVVNTKVTWDDRKMVTTFANVVNVLATREEVTILVRHQPDLEHRPEQGPHRRAQQPHGADPRTRRNACSPCCRPGWPSTKPASGR